MKCQTTVQPEGNACGATATCQLVWPDGDRTPACEECWMRISQLAESHRSGGTVRKEPLTTSTIG
jgi:hypothetical protein